MECESLSNDPHIGKIYAAAMQLHFSLKLSKQARPPAPHNQTLDALVAAHPASARDVADALEMMNAEDYADIVHALRSMAARAEAMKCLFEIEKNL